MRSPARRTPDDQRFPKSAPNPIAAMALINYALGAEQMEIVTQETYVAGASAEDSLTRLIVRSYRSTIVS